MTYLEQAARALCKADGFDPNGWENCAAGETSNWVDYGRPAHSALTAAGFTAEQLDMPVGSLVIVPVRATQRMAMAAKGEHGGLSVWKADDIYRAMVSARPGKVPSEGGEDA